MVTRRISEDKKTLSHPNQVKCAICGSPEVMAEIEGKYYCINCGFKIVRENVLRQIENWKRAGLIPEYELKS